MHRPGYLLHQYLRNEATKSTIPLQQHPWHQLTLPSPKSACSSTIFDTWPIVPDTCRPSKWIASNSYIPPTLNIHHSKSAASNHHQGSSKSLAGRQQLSTNHPPDHFNASLKQIPQPHTPMLLLDLSGLRSGNKCILGILAHLIPAGCTDQELIEVRWLRKAMPSLPLIFVFWKPP